MKLLSGYHLIYIPTVGRPQVRPVIDDCLCPPDDGSHRHGLHGDVVSARARKPNYLGTPMPRTDTTCAICIGKRIVSGETGDPGPIGPFARSEIISFEFQSSSPDQNCRLNLKLVPDFYAESPRLDLLRRQHRRWCQKEANFAYWFLTEF